MAILFEDMIKSAADAIAQSCEEWTEYTEGGILVARGTAERQLHQQLREAQQRAQQVEQRLREHAAQTLNGRHAAAKAAIVALEPASAPTTDIEAADLVSRAEVLRVMRAAVLGEEEYEHKNWWEAVRKGNWGVVNPDHFTLKNISPWKKEE